MKVVGQTVKLWERKQTDGRTDRRYQVHYLPRFAVDIKTAKKIFFKLILIIRYKSSYKSIISCFLWAMSHTICSTTSLHELYNETAMCTTLCKSWYALSTPCVGLKVFVNRLSSLTANALLSQRLLIYVRL